MYILFLAENGSIMIERFQGVNGRRLLLESIMSQHIVRDNSNLAEQIIRCIELKEIPKGTVLIEKNGLDNDLFFILSGKFRIVINNRDVAIRTSGIHVGEMALIDPKAVRCGSVISVQDSVVGKISEQDFSKIADKFPRLWRLLSIELCDRLRQLNEIITVPNPRPVVFIGSSKESLLIAQTIQNGLKYDDMLVKLWTDEVFGPSRFSIEELEKQIKIADFAILLIGPDDKIESREVHSHVPRDNVVFEIGMFMGALGRQRTLLIIPRGINIKIPSDLLGLKPLEYQLGPEKDYQSALGPICHGIRKVVSELKVK